MLKYIFNNFNDELGNERMKYTGKNLGCLLNVSCGWHIVQGESGEDHDNQHLWSRPWLSDFHPYFISTGVTGKLSQSMMNVFDLVVTNQDSYGKLKIILMFNLNYFLMEFNMLYKSWWWIKMHFCDNFVCDFEYYNSDKWSTWFFCIKQCDQSSSFECNSSMPTNEEEEPL